MLAIQIHTSPCYPKAPNIRCDMGDDGDGGL